MSDKYLITDIECRDHIIELKEGETVLHMRTSFEVSTGLKVISMHKFEDKELSNVECN